MNDPKVFKLGIGNVVVVVLVVICIAHFRKTFNALNDVVIS